jgi:hypothetical protein
MKTSRNVLLASGALVALVLTLALTVSGRAVAQTTGQPLRVVLEGIGRIVGDVRITNAADSPIPTRVEGAMEVISSPGTAVRTRYGLRLADTFSRQVTINLGPSQFSGTASFKVPASRLLAIEGFSGFAQTSHPAFPYASGPYPSVHYKTTTNGELIGHYVFVSQTAGGWSLQAPGWGGNKAYADPDSKVDVHFSRPLGPASFNGPASMTLTFVGQYIDQ